MAITKIVVNCETGVSEEIELTAEEIAEMEVVKAQLLAEEEARATELAAQVEAKASAETKLTALGLTPEEIAALIR
jgi:RNA-binding protein YhbY